MSADRGRQPPFAAFPRGPLPSVLVLAAVTAFALGLAGGAGAARAPYGFSRSEKVTAPPNAAHNPTGWLRGVSCTSTGDCTAVGEYEDSSGRQQAMTVTETAAEWGRASEVNAPAGSYRNPGAALTDISCASAGDCTAVGSYDNGSDRQQAVAATETGGKWGPAAQLSLPPGADTESPNAKLDAVSCTSAGNCTGVGHYTNSSDREEALVATESDGRWSPAAELSLPANASTTGTAIALLFQVSCTSNGFCAATGLYSSTSHDRDAMIANEVGGRWGQAAEFDLLPSGASGVWAYLSGVWCTSVGNCEAVGAYLDGANNTHAMSTAEVRGKWSQAAELQLPTNADPEAPNAELAAVSCASVGNCAALGVYSTTESYSRDMVATEAGGKWGPAAELSPPAGAQGVSTTMGGFGNGVACTKGGFCTAVGQYRDSSGDNQAMAATGTV